MLDSPTTSPSLTMPRDTFGVRSLFNSSSPRNAHFFAAKQVHSLPAVGHSLKKRSKLMWKKVLLASAVTGLLASVAIPIQTIPADAAHSGCRAAAKLKYPGDSRARKEFRHWCKRQYKVYKAAHKGGSKGPA